MNAPHVKGWSMNAPHIEAPGAAQAADAGGASGNAAGSPGAPASSGNTVSSAGALFAHLAQLAAALDSELGDISVGEGSVAAAQALAASIGWMADEAAAACRCPRMRDGPEWLGGGPWASTCLGELQQAARGMA